MKRLVLLLALLALAGCPGDPGQARRASFRRGLAIAETERRDLQLELVEERLYRVALEIVVVGARPKPIPPAKPAPVEAGSITMGSGRGILTLGQPAVAPVTTQGPVRPARYGYADGVYWAITPCQVCAARLGCDPSTCEIVAASASCLSCGKAAPK